MYVPVCRCVGGGGEEGRRRERGGGEWEDVCVFIVAHCRYMETCGIVGVLRVSRGEGGGALRGERTLVIGNPTMKQF